jgi:hypothetical protein
MGVSADFPPEQQTGRDPWNARVHVHGTPDQVRGAGILLTDRLVLTCAHVVPRRGGSTDPEPVHVAMIGTSEWHESTARVVPGGWVPPRRGSELRQGLAGDIALLELDTAVPVDPLGSPYGPLRRLAPHRGRRVRVHGFPPKVLRGITVSAQLAGASGEWVQLDPVGDSGPRVTPGYSGAAVVDETTGTVIGMMVEKMVDKDGKPETGVSWMLPIETIVGYLPQLADLVTGQPATDPALLHYRDTPADESQDAAIRELVDAIVRQAPNGLTIVLGDRDDVRSRVLGIVATRADPALRAGVVDAGTAPSGTMPPLASVDVALDATGQTVAQVLERITGRLGVLARTPADLVHRIGTARRTVLVDSVDDAADSDALLTELLIPMSEAGSTVVIGARAEPAVTTRTSTRKLDLTGGHPPPGDGSIAARLVRLGELVTEAERVEQAAIDRHRVVAPRIVGAPQVVARADLLRMGVAKAWQTLNKMGMAAAEADTNRDKMLATLDSWGRTAHWVREQAEVTERTLATLLARRDELRGRLDGYRAVAAQEGFAEDPDLADLFLTADQELTVAPCDLNAADRAVAGYLDALWRRQGRQPDDEPEDEPDDEPGDERGETAPC